MDTVVLSNERMNRFVLNKWIRRNLCCRTIAVSPLIIFYLSTIDRNPGEEPVG